VFSVLPCPYTPNFMIGGGIMDSGAPICRCRCYLKLSCTS
jgi:hypothetical protein